MILHSVITEQEYDILKKEGRLFCDEKKAYLPNSYKVIYLAYEFMANKLNNKYSLSNIHKNIKFPRWGWQQILGETDMNKVDDYHFVNHPEETTYRLSIEIPNEQVLLSDFDVWHCCLNGFPVFSQKQSDEMDYFVYNVLKKNYSDILVDNSGNIVIDNIKKKIYQSWNKIFDPTFNDIDYVYEKRTWQGVFWYIDIKQVIDVKSFYMTKKEYDSCFNY